MVDRLTLTPALYADMARAIRKREDDRMMSALNGSQANLYGMPVCQSNVFPHQFQCGTCGGTGEGTESTYCDRCEGAGQVRIVGMMQNRGQTVLIKDKLPKAFEPYFPAGLVPAPPLCRGLHQARGV